MKISFKEKIELAQQGKYDFATELLELAHKELLEFSFNQKTYYYSIGDYTHWTPKRVLKEDKTENYIAIHLRTIMEKHAKYAYHALRGIRMKEDDVDDLDRVYSTLHTTGHYFFIDDFDKINDKILEDIESKIGYYAFDEFNIVLNELLPTIKKIKIEKKKLIAQIEPSIIESLNEALAVVDITKSDKEIVKFVNMLVDRKTYPKLTKYLETKVHKIDGERYYVTKDQMDFNKVNVDNLLGVDESQLTKNQKLFYLTLKNAIKNELKNCNNYPFTFHENGSFSNINKRYFANLLNIEESAFKKRLIRLQKKKKQPVINERRFII